MSPTDLKKSCPPLDITKQIGSILEWVWLNTAIIGLVSCRSAFTAIDINLLISYITHLKFHKWAPTSTFVPIYVEFCLPLPWTRCRRVRAAFILSRHVFLTYHSRITQNHFCFLLRALNLIQTANASSWERFSSNFICNHTHVPSGRGADRRWSGFKP